LVYPAADGSDRTFYQVSCRDAGGAFIFPAFPCRRNRICSKYGFSSISNYRDFQKKVPIVCYEDFEPYIEKARQGQKDVIWPGLIKQFAKSSGTTNAKSKYIPITAESLEDCHYKAGKDMVALYVNNHPESELFQHKNLRLGGSAEMYQDFNTKFGDLSAILIENLPFWVEIINTPNKKISLMSEWESKMKAIISEVRNEDVGSLTGVPSWMMVLLQRTLQETGKNNIGELWPNLRCFSTVESVSSPTKISIKILLAEILDITRYIMLPRDSSGFRTNREVTRCC
jgi:hypothetical protein